MTPTVIDEFLAAIRAGDVAGTRALLERSAEARAAVNEPIGHFRSRPIAEAAKNLALVDVLLEHGADINLKSDWWAGPFGILESELTREQADALVARGATIDVFGAANFGMLDRLRALIEADPSLVHARGGDGKTPLHYARTLEVAQYLIDHGADVNARDVDHESTAAQYLVREAPDVVRLLIAHGARVDIFMAVGLRDRALVERCLREDPEALDHRVWHGKYRVAHDGQRPATAAEMEGRRGDVYRWVFAHNVGVIDVARELEYDDILALLLEHATPVQRLLAACAVADRASAEALVAAHPGIVATLTPEQGSLIADAAHGDNAAAVLLMVDLGFDPLARGVDDWEPLRWAAFHGNAAMLQALLPHNPPIGVRDPTYGGTPLGQCLYGSLHGWSRDTGDYVTCVQLLLAAGERVDSRWLPFPRADVHAVLSGS
jgi:ankyrin repeat protein